MTKSRVLYAKTPSDHEDDQSMYSDGPTTSSNPPRGKKRKNPETVTKERRVTGRTQAKRVRGNRGILKELVEMPLDVLFEVPHLLFSINLRT